MKLKDLTPEQQKLWRLIRRYAQSEVNYHLADEAYRANGSDNEGLQYAEQVRKRAADRLAVHVGTLPINTMHINLP
jgi:hypothetical protein